MQVSLLAPVAAAVFLRSCANAVPRIGSSSPVPSRSQGICRLGCLQRPCRREPLDGNGQAAGDGVAFTGAQGRTCDTEARNVWRVGMDGRLAGFGHRNTPGFEWPATPRSSRRAFQDFLRITRGHAPLTALVTPGGNVVLHVPAAITGTLEAWHRPIRFGDDVSISLISATVEGSVGTVPMALRPLQRSLMTRRLKCFRACR